MKMNYTTMHYDKYTLEAQSENQPWRSFSILDYGLSDYSTCKNMLIPLP